jgi:hypothetical protein
MKNIFNLIAMIFLFSCASASQEVKIFPIYGNYCGARNPRAFSKLDPISITDFLCEEHIDCYKRNGRQRYDSCDKLLVTELKKASPKDSEEIAARRSIIAYFKK